MPAEVQLSRAKGWRMPPNARSVARPTRWGNIYRVDDFVQVTWTGYSQGGTVLAYNAKDERVFETYMELALTAEQAVWLYRQDLEDSIADGDEFVLDGLAMLRGYDLACWCQIGAPCHRVPLLELANR